MVKKAFRAAFPYTLPVFFGYLFLGAAFGILMTSKGFGIGWAVLMSGIICAGSMQYACIPLLTNPTGLVTVALLTLTVNARHLFYGLSMIEKFRGMKKKKPYMIFSLTDETYSLLCGTHAPEGVAEDWFYFFIALLDHFYCVFGTFVGAVFGSVVDINTKGIDFAMTALFVAIFTEQWESSKNHTPALTGIFASVVGLILFGSQNFILAAMVMIFLLLTLFRKGLEKGGEKE